MQDEHETFTFDKGQSADHKSRAHNVILAASSFKGRSSQQDRLNFHRCTMYKIKYQILSFGRNQTNQFKFP